MDVLQQEPPHTVVKPEATLSRQGPETCTPLRQLVDLVCSCSIVAVQVQQLQQAQHTSSPEVCGWVVSLEAQVSPVGTQPGHWTWFACTIQQPTQHTGCF
jgi:hypothetical protein